jgi:hypothetical protein
MYKAVTTALAALPLIASSAFAHHSFAMFDSQNPRTIDVTVEELEWVNPHIWLRVMVPDENGGEAKLWALELGSPAQQHSVGWERNSVKPGDQITVTIYPLKDGSRGGGLVAAELADGTVLGNGGIRPTGARSSRFPRGRPAGIYGETDEQPSPPGE